MKLFKKNTSSNEEDGYNDKITQYDVSDGFGNNGDIHDKVNSFKLKRERAKKLRNGEAYDTLTELNFKDTVSWQRKITPAKDLAMMHELGYTDKEIDNWTLNRFLVAILVCVVGFVLGALAPDSARIMQLGGLLVGLFMYWNRSSVLKKEYQNYIFEKQVQFSKFMRTVIPYLMNKNQYSFYDVLKKISVRLEAEISEVPVTEKVNLDAFTVVDEAYVPDLPEIVEYDDRSLFVPDKLVLEDLDEEEIDDGNYLEEDLSVPDKEVSIVDESIDIMEADVI